MLSGNEPIHTITVDQLGLFIENSVTKAIKSLMPAVEEPELPALLTRPQTHEYLGVSYMTLHSWAKATPERDAVLVPQKRGSRVYYRREDVLAIVNKHRRFKARKTAVGE